MPPAVAAAERQHRHAEAEIRRSQSEAKSALPPPELRLTLGYEEHDARAKPFVL
jgi:hypothetical protein